MLALCGRKEGIPLERQKHDTKVNKLKRNWYFVIMAFVGIAGLMITLLKTLGII